MSAPDLSQEWREILRCMGRGGMLDKHHRETGLSAEIGPQVLATLTDPERSGSLLQLNSVNQSDPRGVLLNVDMVEVRAGNSAAGTPGFRAQLVVTFGTGKGQGRVVVDLKRGLQLVVPATTLTANAQYLDGDDGLGPLLRVSASIGYGTRPGSEQALTFTEGSTVSLVNGATSVAFKIPPYATRVAWQSIADPTAFVVADANLRFERAPLGAAARTAFANPPRATFVTIPNGSEYISITNVGAAGTSYFLIYELSL